jgi:16S rRNA processing protein RimM
VAAERAAGLVCLGEITGAHGVAGAVRVKGFTEEARSLTAYGPLFESTGTRGFPLVIIGKARGALICRIEGVDTREAARALTGTRLCARREALPETGTDEFYHADLLGLRVEGRDGCSLGELVAIHDFGAGDILEVALAGGGVLDLPFTRAVVPEIDLAAGRIVVEPPEPRGEAKPREATSREPEKKGAE